MEGRVGEEVGGWRGMGEKTWVGGEVSGWVCG